MGSYLNKYFKEAITMASYTQQYDTDGMRVKADEIRRMSTDYEQVMSRMTTLINNLDQVWNAPATRTFQESYAQFQTTFQNFSDKMVNYAVKLELAANDQDEKNALDAQRAAEL